MAYTNTTKSKLENSAQFLSCWLKFAHAYRKILDPLEIVRLYLSDDKHSSLLFRSFSGLYYKSFRIVIYDRNYSTIVEPVL